MLFYLGLRGLEGIHESYEVVHKNVSSHVSQVY